MTLRSLWISLLFACSTSNAPIADTTPHAAIAPLASSRLAFGDVTIALKIEMKNARGEGLLVVSPDGTFTAKATSMRDGKPTTSKPTSGRITANGEFMNDRGEARARIAEDGTVSVLQETEERENGKVVKSESAWIDIGIIDRDGTFTAARDGKTISIAADGSVVGYPIKEMALTVTAAPAQKRLAVFLVITVIAGGKTITDSSGPVSIPATTN